MNTKLFFKTSLIAFVAIALSFQFSYGQSWKVAKDKNGVVVSTRPSATGSSVKDAKGVVEINASLDEALALLQDFPGYTGWMYNCIESKLLKKVSETEYYSYTVTDAPWPVTDRDLVVHIIGKEGEDGSAILNMTGVPDYMKKTDNVRVPKFSGFWKITPLSEDKIRVTYQFSSEPGGKIPDWVANASATDIPLNTLIEMKNRLEK